MAKFIVYEKAREANSLISKLLKSGVKASLADQLERASSSVVLNIAESDGRTTKKEKKRYLAIARGSACESRAVIHLLQDAEDADPELLREVSDKLDEVIKILTVLVYKW